MKEAPSNSEISLTKFLRQNSYNAMGRGRVQEFLPMLDLAGVSFKRKSKRIKTDDATEVRNLYFINQSDTETLLSFLDNSPKQLQLMRNSRSGVLIVDDFVIGNKMT